MTKRLIELGHRRIALLSGYDFCLDAPKRIGIHEALSEAGVDPAEVPEFSCKNHQTGIYQVAQEILQIRPRPTAIIAFDDSLAAVMSFHSRRLAGIKVPDELSIVGFHDWPYLSFTDMALATVRFEFCNAGQKAAEALHQAALTGKPVCDLHFGPTYLSGQSIGPAPVES
jgi:DNA-binding LacI/PurR family transcriptional regulator